MLIKVKKSWQLSENEVTSEALFNRRREFLKLGGAALLTGYMPAAAWAVLGKFTDQIAAAPNTRTLDEELNSYEDITSYNNFYELGTGKGDPIKNADALSTDPWSIEVGGECDNPGTYAIEDLIDFNALEERIYRMRCVEAWSMVIPWVGIPLKSLLKHVSPTNNAKFVKFTTLNRPSEMIGQRYKVLDWPYIEGLRMDEAMHPLTLMATGVYGRSLPNQNGAPLRLVVPWKYGFKSIKSIRKITFTDRQPQTTWEKANAREYGFYANVNPAVDHPRWRQSEERRLPSALFASNRVPTLPFNGYAESVAGLYQGMDLRKYY